MRILEKNKKYFFICIVFLVSLAFLIKDIYFSHYIEIDIQNTESLQVFYDLGNGFNENDSKKISIDKNLKIYRVKLPDKKIYKLRLDLADDNITFYLRSIAVTNKITSKQYSSKDLRKSILNTNDINQLEMSNNYLMATTIGQDPYIVFDDFIANDFKINIWYNIIILILFYIFMYIIFLISKRNNFINIKNKFFHCFSQKYLIKLNATLYILLAFPLLILLLFLIPNLQTPDSNYHFMKEYVISEGDFKITTLKDKDTGGYVDKNIIQYINSMVFIKSNRLNQNNQKVIIEAKKLKFSNEKKYIIFAGSNYYTPLIYFPQALVIKIGKVLDLTIHNTYSFVRLFNILLSMLIIVIALKLLHYGKEVVFVILFMPMTLSQITAVGIDGYIFSLSLLLFSLFLYGLDKTKKWNFKLSFLVWIVLGILISTRPSFVVFGFLFVWIAMYRKSYKDILPLMISAILALLWMLYALKNVVDTRIPRELTNSELLLNFIQEPKIFFTPLFHTISDENILLSYWKMFVGVLGWLDTNLPNYIYDFFGLVLLFALLSSMFSQSKLSIVSRILMFIVVFMSTLLIFFLLWLSWTPIGSGVITGVQGRYFIPLFFGLGIMLSGVIQKNYRLYNIFIFIFIIWIFVLYISLPITLWSKFW